MPFSIKYTLNIKAAGHDGACPSIIQPLSVSPVIVNSIMTTNDLSRSGWTDSLKRPWKRKLGSPSYHKSPVGACYITWDMHMDKPLETLKGILKIISRVHDNRGKPTSSHDGEVAAKKLSEWSSHLHMDNNLNMLKITGLYGWCKDKRNLAGLWPFLTVQGRWILPPFHSKVWLHHVYNINTDKKATGIHQHGLPLEFTMYSMTHSISQISGEDIIYNHGKFGT